MVRAPSIRISMLWSGLFCRLGYWEGLWAESELVMSHLV